MPLRRRAGCLVGATDGVGPGGWTLVDLWLGVSAVWGMVWQAARHRPAHQCVSSAAKVFCGDRACAVADRAMDLFGEHGASHSTGVERTMRDARLNQIYEGTNQINRLAIIESFDDADFDTDVSR